MDELRENPEFAKFIKFYKVLKVPLIQIKRKMKEAGVFDPDLIDVSIFYFRPYNTPIL
jgi:hypothetical protein